MPKRYVTLPMAQWPAADRDGWERACAPPQRLRRGGAACRMKPVTQQAHTRSYGYLLDFCARCGLLDPHAEKAAHVTPVNVAAFLDELQIRVGSVSRFSYLQRALRVAEVLAPAADFRWLHDIIAELKDDMRPRPMHHRIVHADRLLRLGLDLMARAEVPSLLTNLERARLYRDGLMVALLALCPIRLKNFSSLALGRQIRRTDDGWWLELPASETKCGRLDLRQVPPILTPCIDAWVKRWRHMFIAPGAAFWPSIKGGGLAYTYVGTAITRITLRWLGVAVNPHLFRACLVETLALHAGDRMGIASAALQHLDPRITEQHYNKGVAVAEAGEFRELVEQMMADA